ncbi:MAG: protein kinase [Proteobacteria bacterium]|nr:protein kinase [Pseudomonadota bacterium]
MKKPIPFGKYYLLDRISVGGMAEVFKAKAFGVEGFERLIAVKRILPSIAEDEEFITMFIDEAKIAVQLQHANIAQIFDLGKVSDSYFIALEYVSGKDMRSIFDRMRNNGQAIPIPMAAYITMKICEGLDYAHNKKDAAGRDLNLVHRDVSPQNVLVSYDGETKIIDFGIAKAAGKAGKTQAGILKGKFGYMSPEQVRGLPLDRRSDIFAVGICLWEMVTGERLFVGESDFSTLEKVRNVEITPPSTYNRRINEDVEKIVLKALSKEVEDRYQSAMDLHDDLQSWMYTSGSFFTRKDLGAFMQEVFRAGMEKEAASVEGFGEIVLSTVPPPPKAVSRPTGTDRGFAHPGAPPLPPKSDRPARSSPPPPPPPQSDKPYTSTPPPPPKPEARVTQDELPGSSRKGGALDDKITNPPPQSGFPERRVAPPPGGAIKRTMMGMPAPVLQVDAPAAGARISKPPPPPAAVTGEAANVAAPAASGVGTGIGMDDWDEDEPPTAIYSKETAAEITKAAISGGMQTGGLATPGLPPVAVPRFNEIHEPTSEIASHTASKQQLLSPLAVKIGAAAVGLLLIVILLLIFMGPDEGIIQLEVKPNDKLKVIVDGSTTLPGNRSPFKISELVPGDHVITIQRTGYSDNQVRINVKDGETVTKNVALEKVATGFFLETDPPGASVWINDRPLDEKTPIKISDLTAGNYMVRIAKGETYAQKTIEVAIQEGEITKLPTKKLELKAVEITFVTSPQGAQVTLTSGIDRKNIGVTPATATVDTSKEYRIKYSKNGFVESVQRLEYDSSQEKVTLPVVTLTAKTERRIKPGGGGGRDKPFTPVTSGKTGTLSVQTRPWSKVFINGKYIKNTPLVNHPLKAGTYRVTLENPTFKIKKNYQVKIKPGKTTTLVKTLI